MNLKKSISFEKLNKLVQEQFFLFLVLELKKRIFGRYSNSISSLTHWVSLATYYEYQPKCKRCFIKIHMGITSVHTHASVDMLNRVMVDCRKINSHVIKP